MVVSKKQVITVISKIRKDTKTKSVYQNKWLKKNGSFFSLMYELFFAAL